MAIKGIAGKVQDAKQQDQDNDDDPKHLHPAWCAGWWSIRGGPLVSLRHMIVSPSIIQDVLCTDYRVSRMKSIIKAWDLFVNEALPR